MIKKSYLLFLLVLLGLLLLPGNYGSAQQSATGWSDPIDITSQPPSAWRGYAVGFCDPYQNAHIFWGDNQELGSAIFYRNDTSGNWSIPTDVLMSDREIFFLATAFSPRSDTVHLAWANREGSATLFYSHAPLSLASDPKAWSIPRVMEEGIFNPAIQVDTEGVVHIVYAASDSKSLNFDVRHIRSIDDGLTWSEPMVIFSSTFPEPAFIRTEMAIDGADRIHLGISSRSQEYAVFSEIGYIRSLDGGFTWGDYRKLADHRTATAWQGVDWIAPFAFGDNEVHLTWHDPRRMHMISRDGGETWNTPAEIMPLGAAFGGANPITQDSAGNLHTVLALLDGVYSASWDGMQWGPPEQIEDRDYDFHGQQIFSCQGNQLHVLYYETLGPDTTVWYSTRRVDAPLVEREPVPQVSVQVVNDAEQPSLEQTEVAEAVITPLPVNLLDDSSRFSGSPSPTRSVAFGLIPVVILIFGVVVFAVVRKRP